MRDEDWQKVISVNLEAPFALARACLRNMAKKRWGRVIMISSVLASTGNAGQASYCAAKSGLEGLTRALALEFASRSITVNAVAPGLIETDMTSRLMESEGRRPTAADDPAGKGRHPRRSRCDRVVSGQRAGILHNPARPFRSTAACS